jgi:esterase/lipase superfamily enzyme
MGAFHAANFTLRRADVFPLALCMSGLYDISRVGWGERGDTFYFNNPLDYVSHLHGEHLDWLCSRAHLVLVVGRGAWEDSTGEFAYVDPRGDRALLERAPIPSWHELQFRR